MADAQDAAVRVQAAAVWSPDDRRPLPRSVNGPSAAGPKTNTVPPWWRSPQLAVISGYSAGTACKTVPCPLNRIALSIRVAVPFCGLW